MNRRQQVILGREEQEEEEEEQPLEEEEEELTASLEKYLALLEVQPLGVLAVLELLGVP